MLAFFFASPPALVNRIERGWDDARSWCYVSRGGLLGHGFKCIDRQRDNSKPGDIAARPYNVLLFGAAHTARCPAPCGDACASARAQNACRCERVALSIRAVVTGALRFGAGAGTAKLFGILRDAYIARAFGLGEQVDAYLLAQTMAMLPLSVIFLSLQPVLTTAIARRAQAGEISVPRDLAKIIGMGFIALALATLVIWFALPRFLMTLAERPNFALIDGTRVAYAWIVAGAFCSAVSTLGYAVLHSRGKMLSSGLLPD